MAKCKLCKANIPDGTEYCKDCQKKGKTSESYLDSLLKSVKNTAPTAERVYKKKNNASYGDEKHDLEMSANNATKFNLNAEISNDSDDLISSDQMPEYNFNELSIDLEDIEDFDKFYNEDYLKQIDDNIVISDEALFGEDISELYMDPISQSSAKEELNSKVPYIDELPYKDNRTERNSEIGGEQPYLDSITADLENDTGFQSGSESGLIMDKQNKTTDEFNSYNMVNVPEHEKDTLDQDLNPDLEKDTEKSDVADANSNNSNSITEKADAEEEPVKEIDEDLLDLLQQISSEDPVSADTQAINELLNQDTAESKNGPVMPSDVGDVFSDALKAVSSLKDYDNGEEDILNQLADIEEQEKKGKKKKKNRKKTNKKKNGLFGKGEAEHQETVKKSLFQRLFGNIKDDKAQKEKKKSNTSSEPQEATAEVKPKKESKKAKKAKKSKKGSSTVEAEINDNKIKDKKKDKATKKKKEIIQVIDEIDEDEGRINRLGATIVFLFFGLLVALILVGTKAVSYTLNIQNATNYFDKQKYTQAYYEVYGIEVKAEDYEIYDKIMTVMFVNKQLNSYNNYYSIKEYPQALDSLLKGLKRYDKYIELATMLGIKTDLDYVRSQILAELNNVYNLSEKEALDIIAFDNMEEYSKEIYNVVLEKMNK